MVDGTGAIYPRGLCGGGSVWSSVETPGWGYRPKRRAYDDEDNCPNILSNKNHQTWSQKFRHIVFVFFQSFLVWFFPDFELYYIILYMILNIFNNIKVAGEGCSKFLHVHFGQSIYLSFVVMNGCTFLCHRSVIHVKRYFCRILHLKCLSWMTHFVLWSDIFIIFILYYINSISLNIYFQNIMKAM